MRKLDFLGDRYVYEPTFKNGVLFETSDIVDMFAYNLPNAKNNIGMTICKINMELDAQISRVLVEECIFRSLGLPGFLNKHHDKKISSIFALDRVNTSPSYYKGLPSEYDYRLISLLYCDAVKPGMNQVEVREVLMKNRECFKQGKGNKL
ncbi:MAG: DUF2927 domain-containing protein [Candidatus Thiodiazotropha sp. (ex Troendleina suluensis)]|nr:DUF2927 domain-containing protein [Candidatus Thiodiazotropha sp. (ex Troendleina suluensis)]